MKNEEHKKLERLLKEKEKDEVLKKKYQEENDASKLLIKDLEKKLAAKNKALESMTLSCQNALSDLRSTRTEKEITEKKLIQLLLAERRKSIF